MKRIGVITFHKSYNYGSAFQTYALQRVLENLSEDYLVSVIDFAPDNIKDIQGIFVKTRSIRNLVRNMIALTYLPKYRKRASKFNSFTKKYIKLSRKEYKSVDSLKDLKEEYDIVIAGSDQIWNKTAYDFSKGYLFSGVKGVKKIAYAPSISNGTFSLPEDKDIYDALFDFSALSVRELSGAKTLKDFIDKDVPVVLDPTLLLNRKKYLEIATPRIYKKDYIFVYSVNMTENFLLAVKDIADRTGLPIITMFSGRCSFRALSYGIKVSSHSAPEDFISLIRDAKLVVSNSFHGTAFSVILNKNFYSICTENEATRDARISTLLNSLQLQDRILFYENYNTDDYFRDIDYTEVNKRLSKLTERSLGYLVNALNEEAN